MVAFRKSQPSQEAAPFAPAVAQTVIAAETELHGELTGRRPVRIEGTVKGTVHLDAPLEVAAGARVEAEVRAPSVRIAGTVVGNVEGTERVELMATAVVHGNVSAPALHVVEGATLEGRIVMLGASARRERKPRVSE